VPVGQVFACALVLLPTLSAAAAQPPPFYLGAWTIVSAEPGPWNQGILYEDAKLEPASKLAGARIMFRPASVEGPAEFACKHAHYLLTGQTARDLFDERLNNIAMPEGAPKDEADPTGERYSRVKLAERYGLKGFSWKALTICKSDLHFVFANPTTAMFNIGNIVLTMHRE